ncbi:uncharacterized protein PG986_013814 [Apiospora aurea]|uniref:Uncharacterized protein n=1 Tax=Apiospora aurea TaxID=335848 RepID=A0ABR1PWL6_9PEZI
MADGTETDVVNAQHSPPMMISAASKNPGIPPVRAGASSSLCLGRHGGAYIGMGYTTYDEIIGTGVWKIEFEDRDADIC